MADKQKQPTRTSQEAVLNIPLSPEVKSELMRISLFNGRTQRRQAGMYVEKAVLRDSKRLFGK